MGMLKKHGDGECDVLTETETEQVEQILDSFAYSPGDKRYKFLPEGF